MVLAERRTRAATHWMSEVGLRMQRTKATAQCIGKIYNAIQNIFESIRFGLRF